MNFLREVRQARKESPTDVLLLFGPYMKISETFSTEIKASSSEFDNVQAIPSVSMPSVFCIVDRVRAETA